MTSNGMTSNTSNTLPVASGSQERRTRPLARHFSSVARVLLGFFLLAGGAAGLLHFSPPPPPDMPASALAFNAALEKSGYMLPLIFGTQAVVGALLLLNRFVPLALALLAPFTVNALAFHLFLLPQNLSIVLAMAALQLFLAWTHRRAFLPMLSARTAAG